MTFSNPGGGDPSGWGVYALLALIAAPFVVGLVWRLVDRRRGTDDPARTTRPPTWRRWTVRSGLAVVCAIVAWVAWAVRIDALAAAALLGAAVASPTAWPPRGSPWKTERRIGRAPS